MRQVEGDNMWLSHTPVSGRFVNDINALFYLMRQVDRKVRNIRVLKGKREKEGVRDKKENAVSLSHPNAALERETA